MRRNLVLTLLVFLLVLFFFRFGSSQVNEYSLVPVDLQIGFGDSTVEVDIYIELFEEFGMIKVFFVPLFAEGTSNPVLDTVLTGGLMDAYPPAFNPPSLVDYYSQKIVNPYGPPTDPLYFLAMNFGQAGIIPPAYGLFCKMFYRVEGPGTLTFRTAVHSTGGPVLMNDYYGSSVPINWSAEGEVGSFNITQINEYSLVPVNLKILPGGGIVQVNINIATIDYINSFVVPLFAEGTSNPVLDTVLTGGALDDNPPGFAPPSLVNGLTIKQVIPYGPPTEPLLFIAAFGGVVPPASGLYCRMFYHVDGPGTFTFRTAVHSTYGQVQMNTGYGPAPINWPAAGEVGSFNLILVWHGDATGDGKLNITDIIYLIHYLFLGGPPPQPLEAGDANCDGKVTISDIVYLINYLFKGGPPSPC